MHIAHPGITKPLDLIDISVHRTVSLLCESLQAQLHGEGVGITVVHPRAIRTGFMEDAR